MDVDLARAWVEDRGRRARAGRRADPADAAIGATATTASTSAAASTPSPRHSRRRAPDRRRRAGQDRDDARVQGRRGVRPLYGQAFRAMGKALQQDATLAEALRAALEAVQSSARPSRRQDAGRRPGAGGGGVRGHRRRRGGGPGGGRRTARHGTAAGPPGTCVVPRRARRRPPGPGRHLDVAGLRGPGRRDRRYSPRPRPMISFMISVVPP